MTAWNLCKLIGHSAKYSHLDPATYHEPIKCRWCGIQAVCDIDGDTNTYLKPHGWIIPVYGADILKGDGGIIRKWFSPKTEAKLVPPTVKRQRGEE